jgi:hypothetical protein
MIEAALRKTGGRVSGPSGAAALLSVPASTLESKIRSPKINKFRFKTEHPFKAGLRLLIFRLSVRLLVVIPSNTAPLFFETLNNGSQPASNRFFDQVEFENLQRVTRILLHVVPPAQHKRCAQTNGVAASLVTRQGDGHHTREPLKGWILSCTGQGLAFNNAH